MYDEHVCRTTIEDAAFLTVEASTNGLQGGGPGHGGFARVRLIEEAGPGFEFKASADGKGVELIATGDSEIHCLVEALKFAVTTLEAQIHIAAYKSKAR